MNKQQKKEKIAKIVVNEQNNCEKNPTKIIESPDVRPVKINNPGVTYNNFTFYIIFV